MTGNREMFTSREVETARKKIRDYPERPISPAIRFHAALKGLIMDASRSQKQDSGKTILAVDSVEIISHARYSTADLTAFSFDRLVAGKASDPWNAQLEDLDHLISHWMLERKDKKFVLLDSYAREIQSVREAIENKQTNVKGGLFEAHEESTGTDGLTPDALRRIRDFITGAGIESQAETEFRRFLETFIPNWNVDLVDTLVENQATTRQLDALLRSPTFVYVRGPSFGDRSLGKAIDNLDWNGFQEFVESDEVSSEFETIRQTIAHLASSVSKHGRSHDAITIVAENDALAFADIHTLNSFLQASGRQERVELVTRSSLLPDILRALPSGRLNVPLRHPLLLPDIFDFDEGALNAITEISQRFDAVLTPYLEDYENDIPDRDDAREREREDLKRAGEIARDLVRWLRDAAVAQISRTVDPALLEKAYSKSSRITKSDAQGETAKVIREIFDVLIAKLEDPHSPLKSSTLRDLVRRNQDMAAVLWERTFGPDDELVARTLKITSPVLTPAPIMAVRILHQNFTRLFYLHSERGRGLIEKKFKRVAGGDQRPDKYQEIEVLLTRSDTLDQFQELLVSLTHEHGRTEDKCYLIDITLIVCAALASKGEMTAAASLASTVLHEISPAFPIAPDIRQTPPLGETLALQELFVFRQYCERSSAISNYFRNVRHPTDHFMRGLLEKDFARAQRDLDRAAELDIQASENAQDSEFVRSVRLRLIHMAGWIDMYLMTASLEVEGKIDWPERPLLRVAHRRDIWSALGYTKECLDDIRKTRALQMKTTGDPESGRFLAHLEARALQNVIVMFFALLFSRNVPLMDRLLRADHRIFPEHMLKFNNWKEHWEDYERLADDHHFEFRFRALGKLIFSALEELDRKRQSDDSPEEKAAQTFETWSELEKKLVSGLPKQESDGFVKLLSQHIRKGIRYKMLRDARDRT